MTATADDPLEVFRRDLATVLSLAGLDSQFAMNADDETLLLLRSIALMRRTAAAPPEWE